MIYLFAVLVGVWVVLLLLAAGGAGYALADATAGRRVLVATFCGFALILGAAGTVLTSVAYERFNHPVGASANLFSPSPDQASPQPAPSSPVTPVEQYARPAADAWLLFQ